MAHQLRQYNRLTQQVRMTPQLLTGLKILQLNNMELEDLVKQELIENPILEEELDLNNEDDSVQQGEELPSEYEELDFNNEDYSVQQGEELPSEKDDFSESNDEPSTAGRESLKEHLLWQLLQESATTEEEQIGNHIIGNLNRDGYLDATIDDIARSCGVPSDRVEKVLSLLQTFEPIGVCARNLRECLLLQARHLGFESTIIFSIITDHLKQLESKDYNAICRALNISSNDVDQVVNIIKKMEPRPGRNFSDEETCYIYPDVYVYEDEDGFVIDLNDNRIPKIGITEYWSDAINCGKSFSQKEDKYIKEKTRSAADLIQNINKREKTILKVMKSILSFQHEFFKKGSMHLKPMVLQDVAQDIGMHKSTISRSTTNKFVSTPQGVFELKYFFNKSIKRADGDPMASIGVQEKIKKIVKSENPQKPYSDNKISEMLKGENIDIGRRTVTNYRETLGILSSSKRKQF